MFIVTAARDAIHVPDPARPARMGDRARGVNGAPGQTMCGQPAAVAVNAQAARQLYPGLGECGACAVTCRAARNGLRGCQGEVQWQPYHRAYLCAAHDLAAADAEAAAEAH